MKSAVQPKSAQCSQSMRKILVLTHGAVSSGLTLPLLRMILKMHSLWLKGWFLHLASEPTSLTWGGKNAGTHTHTLQEVLGHLLEIIGAAWASPLSYTHVSGVVLVIHICQAGTCNTHISMICSEHGSIIMHCKSVGVDLLGGTPEDSRRCALACPAISNSSVVGREAKNLHCKLPVLPDFHQSSLKIGRAHV